jgi:hypothetical protein
LERFVSKASAKVAKRKFHVAIITKYLGIVLAFKFIMLLERL